MKTLQCIKILVWKNSKAELRCWINSLIEVIIIIFSFAIIIWDPAAYDYGSGEYQDIQSDFFPEKDLNSLDSFKKSLAIAKEVLPFTILYTPDNVKTKAITENVCKTLKLQGAEPYDDEVDMELLFRKGKNFAAIVYGEMPEGSKTLSVSIRFPGSFRTFTAKSLRDLFWITRCNGVIKEKDDNDIYIREGFLQLQHQIFVEWLNTIGANANPLPDIKVRAYRHDTDEDICNYADGSNIVSLMYFLAFLYPFLNLSKRIAREREENLFAHHLRFGFQYWHHGLAHYIVSFLHFTCLNIIVIIIVKVPWFGKEARSFYEIDVFSLFLFLCLYSTALIVFVMTASLLLIDSNNVMLFGTFMWILSYSMFSILLDPHRELPLPWLIFSYVFFFNNAFSNGMQHLGFDDFDEFKMKFGIYFGLALNIVLHVIFMWHCAHFLPGRYIKVRKYNFLWCATIYKKYFKREKVKQNVVTFAERTPSWHNFENPPLDCDTVVKLKNVCTYRDAEQTIPHLQKISLRAYRGEISVLLGHNCSGKTTLLSIIIGARRPELGTVTVNDINVYKEWRRCRRYMDNCMPNNSLFDLLTVSETLHYYITVKQDEHDVDKFEIERNHWLNYLKFIIPNNDTLVEKLEFDHVRLLQLCCALCCGSDVVLLDEPTLHMTFRTRQMFWQIVQLEKPDRAIIATTNSIDEAEMIGDRIGMLNNGVLNAYGTTFFFRTKFGVGFDLILIIEPNTDVEPITAVIAKYFPGITPDNQIGDTVVFKLPANKTQLFQRTLIQLEIHTEELHIKHIKLLGSELSEVFMTFGLRKYKQDLSEEVSKKYKKHMMPAKQLRNQQISAMLFKKIVHQAPNIIPIIMMFVSLISILIIGRMSKVLDVPPNRYNAINLGVRSGAKNLNILKNYPKGTCRFLEINSFEPGPLFARTGALSRIFNENSFQCHQGSFEEYIKGTKTMSDKFGAIEDMDALGTMVWFNKRIFHSAPMALNLAHNLILRNIDASMQTVFSVSNNPMSLALSSKIALLDNQLSHMMLPITAGVIMPITVSCFIMQMAEERRNHIVTLFKISGLHLGIYWFVSLLWDLFTFVAYAILFVLVLALTTIEGFNFNSKMTILLILFFYGFSAIALTYLISMFFYKSGWSSFLIAINIHVFTGLTIYVIHWDVLTASNYFYYIGLFSPGFALLDAISSVYSERKEHEYCHTRCARIENCDDEEDMCELLPQCCESLFQWTGTGIMAPLTMLILSGLAFIALIFLVELYRFESRYTNRADLKKLRSICYPYDDKAVVALKKRIADADMRECIKAQVFVDQLEDYIPKGAKELHTVSFELQKSSCLAIYGPRCSGKTHLIKQLIGESKFSFGDVFIRGHELKYETYRCNEYMGYCPQERGLFGSFTTREMMHVICMIRGVPEDEIFDLLRELSLAMDMRNMMQKKIKNLTFENKRKLNIAITFLVCNDVLILDYPTSGLSPLTRREVWNILRYARFCGKAVIFTTVSSLACEAIADDVLIFDKGEMLAIGSVQTLRQKFTRGFYLEVKLFRDGISAEEAKENLRKDVENLNRFVTFLHEESELRTQIGAWVKFYCPVRNVIYSYLFGAMEKNKRRLNISSYTVSQGTMEDVLLNILDTRLHRSKFNY